jgi:hypothetical protein
VGRFVERFLRERFASFFLPPQIVLCVCPQEQARTRDRQAPEPDQEKYHADERDHVASSPFGFSSVLWGFGFTHSASVA